MQAALGDARGVGAQVFIGLGTAIAADDVDLGAGMAGGVLPPFGAVLIDGLGGDNGSRLTATNRSTYRIDFEITITFWRCLAGDLAYSSIPRSFRTRSAIPETSPANSLIDKSPR